MPSDKPLISVNLCTYNRAAWLLMALESLDRQVTEDAFSYEIVVLDDASTDNTAQVVQEFARTATVPVRYVRGTGEGVAQARSHAIQASRGDWIAFFDDDQLAEPDYLRQLLSLALEKGVSCVRGRLVLKFLEGPPPPLSPVVRAILGEHEPCLEPCRCTRKNFPGTGSALVKRSALEVVGTFDGTLVRGGEDLDLFRRLRMAGFEAWYAPRAVAHHLTPAYRLQPEYLATASWRTGENFANRDCREWNLRKTTLLCLARVGQAVLINVPALAWAWLIGNPAEVLGRKCLLWRMTGYVRGTLFLLSPRLFAQRDFFQKLEFRRERTQFIQQ